MIMRQERKLHFVLTSIRKTSVKSMRNGQTAAIGSPKASSYLARGGKEQGRRIAAAPATVCPGGRDIWLIERPSLTQQRGHGMHPSALCISFSFSFIYLHTLVIWMLCFAGGSKYMNIFYLR